MLLLALLLGQIMLKFKLLELLANAQLAGAA